MVRNRGHVHGYRPGIRVPSWLAFLGGLAIGLFIAFLVYVKMQERIESMPLTAAPAIPNTARAPDASVDPPRFDFYTILPEQEVVIPDQETKDPIAIKEAREVKDAKPAKDPKPAKSAEPKPDAAKSATPSPNVPPVAVAPVPSEGPAVTRKGAYILQVGSFKKAEEADRLRASLALIGIESSVQVVQIGDGENWHRVRVGPFEDAARANQVRNKLKQNKFNSILLQNKT